MDQEKLLRLVDQVHENVALKEAFPNKWLEKLKKEEIKVVSKSSQIQETVQEIKEESKKNIPTDDQKMEDNLEFATRDFKENTVQPGKIEENSSWKVSIQDSKSCKETALSENVEKYQFSSVLPFLNLKSDYIKDLPESILTKYEFGCTASGKKSELFVKKEDFGLKNMDTSPVPTSGSTFNWAASGTSFKPPLGNNWECSSCMVSNKEEVNKCISCEADKPGSKKSDSSTSFAPKMPAPPVPTSGSRFNWGASSEPNKSDSLQSDFGMSPFSWKSPSNQVGSFPTASDEKHSEQSSLTSVQSGFGFGSFSTAPTAFGAGFSFGNLSGSSAGFTFGSSTKLDGLAFKNPTEESKEK